LADISVDVQMGSGEDGCVGMLDGEENTWWYVAVLGEMGFGGKGGGFEVLWEGSETGVGGAEGKDPSQPHSLTGVWVYGVQTSI
jgi:hypothetical protein